MPCFWRNTVDFGSLQARHSALQCTHRRCRRQSGKGGSDMKRTMARRARGQGMTEYIIIVALIAVAAIGVYTAFGDIVRGQRQLRCAVCTAGRMHPIRVRRALRKLRCMPIETISGCLRLTICRASNVRRSRRRASWCARASPAIRRCMPNRSRTACSRVPCLAQTGGRRGRAFIHRSGVCNSRRRTSKNACR